MGVEWRTYYTTAAMAINEFEYQVEDAVVIEAKKNKNYKIAHTNKDVILLLVTIQNVVNKGEYGGKRDSIVTNLELSRLFLTWQQQEADVTTFTKTTKQRYESLVANVGNMPFGETEMLVVLQAYRTSNNNTGVATMIDYYNGNCDEQKEWNETYMDMHLSRKVIMGSNNREVQQDLDKGVRLGNTYYPNELEKATGLILQYDKEKERELLRKKKNKDKYNHGNNNKDNNNNNNDGDDGKPETVGALVVDEDNEEEYDSDSEFDEEKIMREFEGVGEYIEGVGEYTNG